MGHFGSPPLLGFMKIHGMEIKDYREKTPFRTRSKEIVNSKRELGIEVAIGSFQVNKNHESIV